MTATATKSKGMIFTAESVRAILDGRKTMTRRIIKPVLGPQALWIEWEGVGWNANGLLADIPIEWRSKILYCPHPVGSLIYVKEAWGRLPTLRETIYKADEPTALRRWRSPMLMPRWAARLWLEVTGVKVERVQEISEADAIAEGCIGRDNDVNGGRDARDIYASIFDDINGTGSWHANPHVWCYTFRRVANEESTR